MLSINLDSYITHKLERALKQLSLTIGGETVGGYITHKLERALKLAVSFDTTISLSLNPLYNP